VLKERLGENEFAGVADTLLSDISPEAKDKVIPVLGGKAQNRIYRQLLLETITDSWVEYLTKMEALRVSISMESYAQQDPLTKYKQKASTMFSELLSEVRQKVIGTIFLYRPIMPETNTKAPAGRPEDLPAEASPEFTAREAAQSKAASDGKKKRKRH
jgi:preprotein translocase subunit SecA